MIEVSFWRGYLVGKGLEGGYEDSDDFCFLISYLLGGGAVCENRAAHV